MGFLQAVRVLCQFGSVVVLSRLLSPSEFGVVAMAAPVISFAGLFQDLGLSQATVQKRGVDEAEVNAFFWINLGAGACLCALVIALSPLAGSYYHEARAVKVTAAFGALILLGSLGSQPGAIMTRRMLYRASAINGAISAVAGLLASVMRRDLPQKLVGALLGARRLNAVRHHRSLHHLRFQAGTCRVGSRGFCRCSNLAQG